MTASTTNRVKRFDIFWAGLDPARGGEIQKTRPCIVVSPDEMNDMLKTVLVVPLTSRVREWPFRVIIHSTGKRASAACDQVRSIDKGRLLGKIGRLRPSEQRDVLRIMRTLFVE